MSKFTAEELPTGFVGRSLRIVQIRDQIEKLSLRRSPVLLQGESGTGKEVAARSLHNANPRGVFVPIDCGSLVGPLMESELFGHTRGAFTGASEAKRGLIEVANGGTAFFDEIGDLPLEMQVKLLRVLQEKEFRPVGSVHRMPVDIRVIAATHRDLRKEVAAGRFREDLFYRLNVLRLTLPPLRERKDDIPLLVERFLAASDGRYVIAHEAMDAITRYDWPGNIRELKNCIERMIAFSNGPLLQFVDMPTAVQSFVRGEQFYSMATVAGGSKIIGAGGKGLMLPTADEAVIPLVELEKRAIQHALRTTRGDRTIAAQLLGIGRTTLYRKIRDFGLGDN